MTMLKPIREKSAHYGIQKIYKFDNGFFASVIRHSFSYGGDEGLWEIAVLSGSNQSLDYSTPITDDVVGRLNDSQVENTLKRIAELPPKGDA